MFLQSPASKITFLRDLCKKTGIKISSSKEYIFDNDPKILEHKLTQVFQKELVAKSKKGKGQNLLIDPMVMRTYAALPFQPCDIVELFPTLKTLDI
jgi:hypothetical protein